MTNSASDCFVAESILSTFDTLSVNSVEGLLEMIEANVCVYVTIPYQAAGLFIATEFYHIIAKIVS